MPATPITAAHLAAAADLAHDEACLPTPESAGFEENAIRDFLQTYPAFKVPNSTDGSDVVHAGSLMAGIAIGAVAARAAASTQPPSPQADCERLRRRMLSDEFVCEARRRFGHPSDPHYAERFRVFIDAAFDTLAAIGTGKQPPAEPQGDVVGDVERFDIRTNTERHREEMVADGMGGWVRYSDYEKAREEGREEEMERQASHLKTATAAMACISAATGRARVVADNPDVDGFTVDEELDEIAAQVGALREALAALTPTPSEPSK
jgi:hypothetical protein